jgi:DNA-binding SARP family transcriptional activator/tetratricopeptide (TPR) repeat protein
LELRLVGRFEVVRDGRALPLAEVGTRKARTLLKLLAASAPQPVPTDVLVEALWPQRAPSEPAGNLATLVSRLRGSLGASVVDGQRTGWALGPAVVVDVEAAAGLVSQAQADLPQGRPAVALAAASAALDRLERGTVLSDEPDAPWCEPVRSRVATLLRAARHLAAEAALAVADPGQAAAVAARAVGDDPYDEPAVRLLMAAARDAGEPSRALAAFERLRGTLADELGADPAPETRALHLAVLTEVAAAPMPAGGGVAAGPAGSPLPGREAESAELLGRWYEAVAGRPGLVLLAGEAGIGKTSLAGELAERAGASGGTVLAARCYDTERSLFLQPVVDAVRPQLLHTSPATLREVAGDRAPALALLVPEVAELLGPVPRDVRSPEAERRQAYDAVGVLLRRMAARAPVLLLLDDLHNAGLATVELLHLLARQATTERLLVVATVRSDEASEMLRLLADVAVRVDVGPLDAEAVGQLASAAGHPEMGPRIAARTGGHPLFVVEVLRALAAGDEGVPASLTATVLARVARLGPEIEELVHAAAVLGASFDPETVAGLLELSPPRAVRGCERLVEAGLAVVAGRSYEFANDLVQEVVYAATPEPTRYAYHRLAAGLLTARPEAAAQHAAACGEWDRAAQAWLAAAQDASARFAVADAERIVTLAVDAAGRADDPVLQAQALLARGREREVLGSYADSVEDHTRALALAQDTGQDRLAMLAHRELAGDAPIAMGRPLASCTPHLLTGLAIAEELGDKGFEADLLARLAVLSTNRLDFVQAREHGLRAVAAGRDADERALLAGLDGLKTTYAYLGDLGGLDEVVAEMEPLARRRGDLLLLQWVVFEHAFVPLAAGEWDAATARIEEALALCRRSGRLKYEGWYVAFLGWVARLAGRPADAVGQGRRSVEASGGGAHSWFTPTATAMYATTLLEQVGEPARPQAVRMLRSGLAAADRSGAESYRLRCLAPLAWATGRRELAEQADRMLADARLPEGNAWLLGVDAYVSLARAWVALDERERARAVLAPLVAAGGAMGWSAVLEVTGAPGLLAAVT